jgi:class 3 adenylate cyclase
LSGLEQVDAIRRGLVQRSPLSHLIGLTVTHAGPGTATVTAPASPWLDFGDGLDFGVLGNAALSMAALCGAPPGVEVRSAAISATPFRAATLEAGTLIARARTIRSAPAFTYAEVAIQDDLGRDLARGTGTLTVQLRNPPPPAPPRLVTPFEEPAYRTPDPYLRPLPPGVRPFTRAEAEGTARLDLMRAIVAGEFTLPIFALFDIRGLEAEPGYNKLALRTSEWFCHHDRVVNPGVIARLASQAVSGAGSTVVPAGTRIGVINFTMAVVRPVTPDGQDLVAEGWVTDHLGDAIVSRATVTGADGTVVATAYQTAVLLPVPHRPPTASETVVATVLFTDLVGSTARAQALGDEQWRLLLRDHDDEVRRQLAAFAGREIKTTGDGFLATFDSPARAARCAAAIRAANQRLGLDVKAGVHTGECTFADGDVTGIAVHLAARVLERAAPGEVLVSGTVRDLLLGSELRFSDRGRHELKGIDGDWPLFALED